MQTCWCVFFSEGESFFAIFFVAQKRTRTQRGEARKKRRELERVERFEALLFGRQN